MAGPVAPYGGRVRQVRRGTGQVRRDAATARPDNAPRPDDGGRPDETAPPHDTARPRDTARPDDAARCHDALRPDAAAYPGETGAPGGYDTAGPESTARAGDTARAGETAAASGPGAGNEAAGSERWAPAARWWRHWWSVPAVAVAVAAVTVIGTRFAARSEYGHPSVALVVLLLVGPAALLLRRRWPGTVLVVITVTTVLYYGLGFPYGPQFTAFAVALVVAVGAGRRVLAWVCGFGALAAYFPWYALRNAGGISWTWLVGHVAAVAAILALSELFRVHQQRVAEQRRVRAERQRRRANEERLRIAQELHDVLAHNISLINVQAGVALHLMDQRPEQARTALSVIKQASKEALGEMRSALAVLRGDTYAAGTPAPGLDRLDELTARLTSAGLPVRTTVSGARRPLPVQVDLAAYRIVQEALTNVYRHARASEAVVSLAYRPDLLTVLVTDDGVGGPPATAGVDGGGNGIPGMRERATALGGSLSAGPLPGGGFRVVATFPLTGEAP